MGSCPTILLDEMHAYVPSLSHGTISPVSSLQRIPTSPHRPGKLPCELLATAAVQTSYVNNVQSDKDTIPRSE